ncbi:MAG: radical SAM protein [Rhodospirillaceae bacterium]
MMSDKPEVKNLSRKDWAVPDLPERYLLDLETVCNLKCPMCLFHGDPEEKKKHEHIIGKMTSENLIPLLDEMKLSQPVVAPSWWGEPLLIKNLKEQIREMKQRDIVISFNTNGLTLTEDIARFLVEMQIDSIFFSFDAVTPETLKKVRGVDKLDKIANNCEMMLRVRDEAKSTMPRIGASYTIQRDNEHEVEEFIKIWTKKVDVVRVGYVFEDGGIWGIKLPEERIPCSMLYHSLPIHFNGDASICCFDSYGYQIVGNVFKDGIKAVWHGEALSQIRHYHETGQWDMVPFCQNCNAWAGQIWEEEMTDELLIRRSVQMTYYNRLDRMTSWHEGIKGGHTAPDREGVRQRIAENA